MRDEVTRALKLQADERARFESALTAARELKGERRRLPADSSEPGELFELTLETIHVNEAVARAYARVASQAGVLAQASLDLARTLRADIPEMSDEQRNALQRAEAAIAGLPDLRP
jgi:hypothetical protein